MTPQFTPLLDPSARQRRRDLLGDHLDPAADFLLNTPFQPGLHTLLAPRLPAKVRQHLVSVEHDRHVRTGELRRRIVPLVVAHGDHDQVPWGLVPLMAQAAVALGAAAPVMPPSRPEITLPPDLSDPLVPARLLAHRRLVVRHQRGVIPAALIASLLRGLRGRRIAVIVSGRRDGGQLVAQLRAMGIDARGFFTACHGYDSPPPQVAVGTAAGLASSSARATGCSVVVTLDAIHFCGEGGVDVRSERAWRQAYWLGLVADNRTVSPLEHDRLICFFGPAELAIPAHGQVGREVVFVTQPVARQKGRGYERHVMRLAGELADRQLGDGSWQFAVVPNAAGIPGPVVVLADDRRHRRDLERELHRAYRGRVLVVTPDELAAGVKMGVLVRADGRATAPPFGDSQLTESQTNRTPLLVVDAIPADVAARERVHAYRSEGWVSVAAHRGGFDAWERWTRRPLPGRRPVGQTSANH